MERPRGDSNWPFALPLLPKENKNAPFSSKHLHLVVHPVKHVYPVVLSHRNVAGLEKAVLKVKQMLERGYLIGIGSVSGQKKEQSAVNSRKIFCGASLFFRPLLRF